MNPSIFLFKKKMFVVPKTLISRKSKVFIAILTGIVSLLLTPYTISFSIDNFQIDLPWTIVFPIIISLSYGANYSLITSVLGGCLFPIILWPNNGITTTITFFIYTFYVWTLGLGVSINEKPNSFFHMKRIGFFIFLFICIEILWYCYFNGLVAKLNHFIWPNETFRELDSITLVRLAFKNIINVIVMTTLADVLLALPFFRKIMGLELDITMRTNEKLICYSFLIYFSIFSIFIILERLIFDKTLYEIKQHDFIFWYLMTFVILFFSRIMMTYISTKNRIQDNIERQNKELEIAQIKASESDQLKSAFLNNLSHEIRTPMNAIVGFTEFVIKEKNIDYNEKRKYHEIINDNSQYLLSLINNIIEISTIETNELKVSSNKFNLTEFIKETINAIKADHLRIELVIDDIDPDLIIATDKTKLSIILKHLINNAVKFTSEGTITIKCIKTKNQKLHFSVTDTGIGIDPTNHKTIFNRFTKGSSVKKGSGLGLSISKAYVELLGGTLKVESQLNIGSTFYFSIPLITVYQNTDYQQNVNFNHKTSNNKELILIAEDNKINFLLTKKILEKHYYDILWAKDGKEAIEKYKKHKNTSLILMDLSMPIMGGYQATKEIRKISSVPIIAHTAHALTNHIDKIKASGFDDYICKPIDEKNLIIKIKNQLNKTTAYNKAN